MRVVRIVKCGICWKVTSSVRSDLKGFLIILEVTRTYLRYIKKLLILYASYRFHLRKLHWLFAYFTVQCFTNIATYIGFSDSVVGNSHKSGTFHCILLLTSKSSFALRRHSSNPSCLHFALLSFIFP